MRLFLSGAGLLLGNDEAPRVLLAAVHDVADPALDLAGDLAGGALGTHGDIDVLAAVVNLRDGANEVLNWSVK